jgi:mannose/fructose/N-acetylgalactosamine-specific phosphotransferase system component IIC
MTAQSDSAMRSRIPVVLGIVGGALSALGFSLSLAGGLFPLFLHHTFIMGFRWTIFLPLLALPVLFLCCGLLFIRRALRN